MKTRFGVRSALLAVPVLAIVGALTLSSTHVQAAAPEAALVAARADVSTDVPVEVSEVVADELALAASNCTYYNNASHSQIVGQFGYDCCNNPVAWGRKTRYSVCGGCFPCIPPPQ